jgi:hypothetical protein
MPNKTVASWTQVPVTAAELVSIHYDRLNAAGTSNNLTVTYEIKDNAGTVRQTATLMQQVASYPISVAAILSSINTAQGT